MLTLSYANTEITKENENYSTSLPPGEEPACWLSLSHLLCFSENSGLIPHLA